MSTRTSRNTTATWLLRFGACAAAALACGNSGGSCPADPNPATFTGPLTTSVPTEVSLSGSSSVTITVENFQPDVEQSTAFCDSPQRYCGAQTFPVILGDECQVMVNVDDVTYDTQSCDFISASASVVVAQSCALPTSGGTLSMTVQSGTFSASMSSIQLTFDGTLSDGSGASATLQFQGS